jgi:hypothetical protein
MREREVAHVDPAPAAGRRAGFGERLVHHACGSVESVGGGDGVEDGLPGSSSRDKDKWG